MLNSVQRQKVFDSIPNILNGRILPKFISDQYIRSPVVPGIEITYLTQGTRARWSTSPITQRYNADTREWEERWGQIHKCTISVVISSHDKTELFDMAADMLKQIFQRRLGLKWSTDRVKFIDVISEPIYQSVRLEQDRRLLHRAHIDIWLEYEVSWWVDFPVIRRYGADIQDTRFHYMLSEPGAIGCTIRIT